MATYTENAKAVMNFLFFCYNYDKGILHNGLQLAAQVAGIPDKDYYWDYFMGKCNSQYHPENNIESQYALIETMFKIGSIKARNAFIEWIMSEYKGV